MMSSIMPLLLLSTFGGYLIGWFVLLGDRLFVRRLDAFLIFLIILFAMQGIRYLPSPGGLWRRVGIFVGILVYAWIGTATYASGPDMRVVSQAEFDAASYIWQEEDHALSSHCVVGDTWMLLALEGISGRKIVGGNFPIDSQFGQNDRIHVYGEMIVDPSIDTLDTAHELTSALRCWVVLPKDHVSGNVREKIDALTKSDVQDVGNLYLWREALKPEPLPDGEGEA